jgi:hypothetical protein
MDPMALVWDGDVEVKVIRSPLIAGSSRRTMRRGYWILEAARHQTLEPIYYVKKMDDRGS